MTMTRAELAREMHKIAIRLKNEQKFYERFKKVVNLHHATAHLRQAVFDTTAHLRQVVFNATRDDEGEILEEIDRLDGCYRPYAGREYLSRYFLMTWNLSEPHPESNERKHYPPFEFWLDKEQWPDQVRAGEPQPQTQEQSTMLKITTKTLINGDDIAKKSDDELFEAIAQAEAEIAKLQAIAAKPKALVAKVEELQAGIAALVAHMDSKV